MLNRRECIEALPPAIAQFVDPQDTVPSEGMLNSYVRMLGAGARLRTLSTVRLIGLIGSDELEAATAAAMRHSHSHDDAHIERIVGLRAAMRDTIRDRQVPGLHLITPTTINTLPAEARIPTISRLISMNSSESSAQVWVCSEDAIRSHNLYDYSLSLVSDEAGVSAHLNLVHSSTEPGRMFDAPEDPYYYPPGSSRAEELHGIHGSLAATALSPIMSTRFLESELRRTGS